VLVRNITDLLVLARKTATELRDIGSSATRRLNLCVDLLEGSLRHKPLADLQDALSTLELNQRHYWIGTFYTLLLPAIARRAQAAYFTPPHIADALLGIVQKEGFDVLSGVQLIPLRGELHFYRHLLLRCMLQAPRTRK
jgi:adenine-specific DNA-methyltransferase